MLNHSLVPVGSTGYDIPYSARFDDALLSRTTGTHTNRNKMTISAWFKRSTTDDGLHLWRVVSGSDENMLRITGDQLLIGNYQGGYQFLVRTNRLFRDPSAWYHILISIDTTQATASDRVKMYINGELETSLQTATYPSLNFNIYCTQSGLPETIADDHYGNFTNGYFADFYRIDGQALTPADFGETDEDYGHWKPIKYAGTYGSDGYYLDFKTSGNLGDDVSGNTNDFTVTGLAATDQMLDSPTNNFCTLNPLDHDALTFSEGNLTVTNTVNDRAHGTRGTLSLTGKHYWEVVRQDTPGEQGASMGVCSTDIEFTTNDVYIGYYPNTSGIYGSGQHRNGSSTIVATYATQSAGSIMMFAYDADTGKFWIGKDGTWFNSGVPASGTGHVSVVPNYATKTYSPAVTAHNNVKVVANFGQDSSFAGNKTAQGNADGNGYGDFYYTPPTGYLALCTQNLPEPTVVPSEHFNTVLYTGTGAAQSITGVGFQPDFIWVKHRQDARDHGLVDVVRGTGVFLESNTRLAEQARTTGITSFDTDGFSLGSDQDIFNESGGTPLHVAWNWKANGAGVSNTNGSVTTTVSANVDAGFSIVSYTGTGSVLTAGHGLSVAPEMVIVKNRDVTINSPNNGNWRSYHIGLHSSTPENYKINLNDTSAATTGVSNWNNTAPTATVFTVGTDWELNQSGQKGIAYAFHSVEGYSKVGSYTGNYSTDGPFVHCGFRPKLIIVKRTNGTYGWMMYDSEREPYNVMHYVIQANLSSAESASDNVDFVSNGFKLRTTGNSFNGSGGEYIFIAFAENPFKYTNAR